MAIIKLLTTKQCVRQLQLIIHNQINKMSIPPQNHSRSEKWLQDMKGSISLTVSIIATMTFSLATNPPGGVVQASLSDITRCSNVTNTCVGHSILATYFHEDYLIFLTCNTICFIASISVIFLLVSGVSINDKISIWLLSIGMSITLTSLALTYLFAAYLVTPDTIWSYHPWNGFGIALIAWIAIVLIVYVYLVVRAFVRCCKKCCV